MALPAPRQLPPRLPNERRKPAFRLFPRFHPGEVLEGVPVKRRDLPVVETDRLEGVYRIGEETVDRDVTAIEFLSLGKERTERFR